MNNNDSVGKRLKERRRNANLTQRKVADLAGISRSHYGSLELDRYTPSLDTLKHIAKVLGVDVVELIPGSNEDIVKVKETAKELSKQILSSLNPTAAIETLPYVESVKLPILGSVRAGVGGCVNQELIGYENAFTPNCSPETHFYLKVKGNSMEPRILEGDLALVKMQNDVESGELAIVLINGDEGVIKKVIKKENSIELHSFNPYYPPRVFAGEHMNDVRIIGKVIKTMADW